ncbi:MAG: flagellar assembly protein FliH [Azoarcus sp.]|jgi:flagellar assembly protein FliH|nr:flagellar assembly protein FliH [Azoarcus sp.]
MKNPAPFTRHQAVGAYRQWEPPKFDAPPAVEPEVTEIPETALETAPGAGSETLDTGVAASLPPGLKLPTAMEIEQMHDAARSEGHEAGLAEGRNAGHAEGFAIGREEGRAAGYREGKTEAEAEAVQLREMIAQMNIALGRIDAEVAEELLSLAIELARKVLQHSLAVEPEAVLSAVRAALQRLPESRAKIHMHPADAALARKHLDEMLDQSGHLIIEDDSVSRGGCRVETPGAQIDATMETRWRRVLDSLGRQHAPWSPMLHEKPRAKSPASGESTDGQGGGT